MHVVAFCPASAETLSRGFSVRFARGSPASERVRPA